MLEPAKGFDMKGQHVRRRFDSKRLHHALDLEGQYTVLFSFSRTSPYGLIVVEW